MQLCIRLKLEHASMARACLHVERMASGSCSPYVYIATLLLSDVWERFHGPTSGSDLIHWSHPWSHLCGSRHARRF